MAEIVENGRTGLHFSPGDASDLADIVLWAWAHPTKLNEMGHEGRKEYESKYTPEKNYQSLRDIYSSVI
jgi:glycosyltransferase involved in cell wall biosynthesis